MEQNRVRTEPLVVELATGSYLVDLSTDKHVPTDVLFEGEGWKKVRFLAEDIPAMGYRGYAIRYFNAPKDPPRNKLHESSWTIENAHYRLTLNMNSGGIKSLVDKAEQRELADQADSHALNQYLYVSGGNDSLIKDLHFCSPPAELTIAAAGQARLIENVDTPLGQRIVVEASAKKLLASEVKQYVCGTLKQAS